MSKDFVFNLAMAICLVLVQVLICNHIFIFNVAMSFIFIYLIIRMPMDMKTDAVLTWAFFSGLLVDLFSDTPGVNSLACTVLAMVKKPCLYAYVPRDDRTKGIRPTLKSLGFAVYSKYLLTMSGIYCLLAFSVEYFNFADIKEIAIMTASSAVMTFLVILGTDCLIVSNEKGL